MGLWSIKINPESGKTSGVATKLFAGDRRDFIISSSLVGDSLAFCQMDPAIHIWRIDHANHPKPKAARITQDTEFDFVPHISQNGRWLAFARGYSGNRRLYLRDMVTGSERMVASRETEKLASLPNESGTAIAYEASDAGVPGIYVAGFDGIPRRLCTGCRNPTGWGPDNESILFNNSASSEVRIMQISDGKARTILSVSGGGVRDAVWSAANHFIVFSVSSPGVLGQVFAARFPPGNGLPDSHWIEITNRANYSRRPVWSGDGRSIFYLSNRDGFWCIWKQQFDPVRGRSIGKPISIFHFHDFKQSPAEISGDMFGLSAAGDSLYLNLAEFGGTIFVGKLVRESPLSHIK
jgi:Tol biopolymer transport system component